MKKTVMVLASSVVGSLLMAGCGTGTHPSAAPSVPATLHTTTAPVSPPSGTPSTSSPGPSSLSSAAPSGTDASTSTAAPSFSPVVQQDMGYIAPRTVTALEAPKDIPVGTTRWYLGSSATASANAYSVQLQLTTTPLGLNSPDLNQGPNAGLAHFVGAYGGVLFQTAPTAVSALTGEVDWTSPPSSGLQAVNLGNGIEGQIWTASGPVGVEWTEGEWTLQATGVSRAAVVGEASRIVAYLHTHLLPETRGVFTVMVGGDGDHTDLSWEWGKTNYYVRDYHSALGAAMMAMSMTAYPRDEKPWTRSDTPPFAGQDVSMIHGRQISPAIPNGYPSATSADTTFSASTDQAVEGFRGTLHGKPFILDFYEQYPVGQFIGVSYNNRPVFFGEGPSPMFDVLNFTGDDVVLGATAAGTYMAINLENGQTITNPSEVVPLKGFTGLVAPPDVLGLPATQDPTTIPYGPQ